MRRLVDELGPGFERDLLTAGRSEQYDIQARDRALAMARAALGVQVVAQAASQAATAAGSGSSAGAGGVLASIKAGVLPSALKVIVAASLGVATAGTVLYGTHSTKSERSPVGASKPGVSAPRAAPHGVKENALPPATDVSVSTSPASSVTERADSAARATQPKPHRQRTQARTVEAKRASSPQLSVDMEEIRLIDEARAGLAAQDASKALGALHAYRKRPGGVLGTEADLLEVKALLALGRRRDAEALAQQALQSGVGPAYRAKLEALLAP
jgi:hypothetical protein